MRHASNRGSCDVNPLATSLAVGLGGSLGALARYGTAVVMARWDSGAFPLGTFAANLLGCLLFGMLRALMERHSLSPVMAGALTTGFLGAYTTFSTFSFETMQLVREGHGRLGLVYVFASVIGGIGLAWLGYRALAPEAVA